MATMLCKKLCGFSWMSIGDETTLPPLVNTRTLILGPLTRAPNITSNTIISALASIHYGTPLDGPTSWVQSVRSLLSTGGGSFDTNDLASLISQCQRLNNKGIAGGFLQMLSAIQLTFKCEE